MTEPETPSQADLAAMDAAMARPFRVVYPDRFVLHGVQFPSGRCVVDAPAPGLWKAAVSVEALELGELAQIEWGGADAIAAIRAGITASVTKWNITGSARTFNGEWYRADHVREVLDRVEAARIAEGKGDEAPRPMCHRCRERPIPPTWSFVALCDECLAAGP